jgi:hypothetical protein
MAGLLDRAELVVVLRRKSRKTDTGMGGSALRYDALGGSSSLCLACRRVAAEQG